jgi:NTP pyrophosphatase (non-canonical NTP hydrolase)
MGIVTKAKEVFDRYAGMDAPTLPDDRLSALQVALYRWEVNKFKDPQTDQKVLGANEEVGEFADELVGVLETTTLFVRTVAKLGALNHAVLKNRQGIRGFADKEFFREKAGDAIADIFVYLIQLCTALRLDWFTLLEETSKQVMKRDWKEHPKDAHERI